MEKRLFTSESVTEGHPDKICDQISDAVLDALYEQDPYSRVACETLTNTGFIMVMGEVTTKANIDIPSIVRKTVTDIGYDSSDKGFDGNTCAVMVALDKQSADIAMGVDKALEAKDGEIDDSEGGAGDQGMMFGYATNETPEFMPYSSALAQKLSKQLTKVRKDGTLSYLRPDGKTQVTVEYDENKKPIRLDAIVVSSQHAPEVSQEQIHEDIKKYVIDAIVDPAMIDADTKIYINPTGRFVIGGPNGDSGLTGRKIIVDTYGGAARHGGVPSLVRTALRLTVLLHTLQDMLLRILSLPDLLTDARFSFHMQSVLQDQHLSWLIHLAQESLMKKKSLKSSVRTLI